MHVKVFYLLSYRDKIDRLPSPGKGFWNTVPLSKLQDLWDVKRCLPYTWYGRTLTYIRSTRETTTIDAFFFFFF